MDTTSPKDAQPRALHPFTRARLKRELLSLGLNDPSLGFNDAEVTRVLAAETQEIIELMRSGVNVTDVALVIAVKQVFYKRGQSHMLKVSYRAGDDAITVTKIAHT